MSSHESHQESYTSRRHPWDSEDLQKRPGLQNTESIASSSTLLCASVTKSTPDTTTLCMSQDCDLLGYTPEVTTGAGPGSSSRPRILSSKPTCVPSFLQADEGSNNGQRSNHDLCRGEGTPHKIQVKLVLCRR